jgi:hypothetical protein
VKRILQAVTINTDGLTGTGGDVGTHLDGAPLLNAFPGTHLFHNSGSIGKIDARMHDGEDESCLAFEQMTKAAGQGPDIGEIHQRLLHMAASKLLSPSARSCDSEVASMRR